jgi:hypothetical protein
MPLSPKESSTGTAAPPSVLQAQPDAAAGVAATTAPTTFATPLVPSPE